jgi:4-hydroxybenzoate polyprenyltransferase
MIKASWFDTLFILRPTLFFPSWTFFLTGYSRGQGTGPGYYLIWLGAALGASFLLNQISDRKEDQLNNKLLFRWRDLISPAIIYIELAFLLVIVVIGCALAGKEITALLVLFFLIAGIFYNFPPLRFKSRPIMGVVSCAVGIWIGYLIGARAAGVSYSVALPLGFPYALAGAAVTLLTHIPDLRGDRQAGMRTFPIVYGESKTAGWALGLVILCVPVCVMTTDYALLFAAVISLPFFYRFYKTGTAGAAEFAVKISILSLAVAVGLSWIPFLAMIAAYYPFARWYHRTRLNLDYPSFRWKRGEIGRREPSTG